MNIKDVHVDQSYVVNGSDLMALHLLLKQLHQKGLYSDENRIRLIIQQAIPYETPKNTEDKQSEMFLGYALMKLKDILPLPQEKEEVRRRWASFEDWDVVRVYSE